jgi:hypothetical protein
VSRFERALAERSAGNKRTNTGDLTAKVFYICIIIYKSQSVFNFFMLFLMILIHKFSCNSTLFSTINQNNIITKNVFSYSFVFYQLQCRFSTTRKNHHLPRSAAISMKVRLPPFEVVENIIGKRFKGW